MEKPRPELDFTASADDILRILIHSKEYGNVIGISSPQLGSGIFITAVDKVILDYEIVVQLKPHDVNGEALEKNVLRLTDISTACAFKSKYDKLYHKLQHEELHSQMVTY
jgi:hypothetical protein